MFERTLSWGVIAIVVAVGCGYRASVGELDTDAGEGDDGGLDAATVDATVDPARDGGAVACTPSPDPAPLRHLTRFEIRNALADLIGSVPPSVDALPSDEVVGIYEAGAFPLSARHVQGYRTVAMEVSATILEDLDAHAPCPAGSAPADCAETFLRSFARRAWRRPPTDEEVAGLLAVFGAAGDRSSGTAAVVEAILQSPHFLYRVELGIAVAGRSDLLELTDHEVATRLASLLWRGQPDEALLSAADRGELGSADAVEAQARRMLADPRAERSIQRFAREWLGYDRVTVRSDADVDLAPELEQALLAETDRYVQHVLFEGDRSFETLLTSPFTFVDDQLASYYGVTAPPGTGLRRVDLDPAQRASLLTHGSVVATYQRPTERGMLIRQRMLCTEVPAPPPDIGDEPLEGDPEATRRQTYEAALMTQPACWGCHQLIDPIGFGLESYDSGGRHRTIDNGQPVDDSGEIISAGDAEGTFTGGVGLAHVLAGSGHVHRCFAKQWVGFGLRRLYAESDDCLVGRVTAAFQAADLDIHALIVALVRSETFRFRAPRGGSAPPPADPSQETPLEAVAEHLRQLLPQLTGADRAMLEHHLEQIRDLEARL